MKGFMALIITKIKDTLYVGIGKGIAIRSDNVVLPLSQRLNYVFKSPPISVKVASSRKTNWKSKLFPFVKISKTMEVYPLQRHIVNCTFHIPVVITQIFDLFS